MNVLVLSGGGSKGAWQAGVLHSLVQRKGYQYDAIVGTSVGSLNGLGYSCLGIEGLISVWKSLKGKKSVMSLNWDWPWKLSGIYDFDPLEKLIRKFREKNSPKIPTYSTHINLKTNKIEYVRMGESVDADISAVIGSCSVTGIHRLTKQLWMDGGHKEIAPVWFAYKVLKATEVHVILTDPIVETEENWKPASFLPILSAAARAIECMTQEILKTDINPYPNARIFAPDKPLPYNSLRYNPREIQDMLLAGQNYVIASS